MTIRSFVAVLAVAVVPFVASCGGSSNSTMPDAEGTGEDVSALFSDQIEEERETVMISPMDPGVAEYQVSYAVFDTVIVRSRPGTSGSPRRVDALVKGSFPDGCTELHEVEQESTPEGASVELSMRRPESAICTQVVRPYRFFFEVEKQFEPGSYSLVVNDRSYSFEVK